MLNNCTFQGRFAADPEMRTTQSGLTVASFRMAVDRDNVGQDGRRATDWLNFVAWRKTAEFVCQYTVSCKTWKQAFRNYLPVNGIRNI